MRALLAATSRTGVAALFGIAERHGDSFHITQLYGHDGRLGGVYRKRHLGEDEGGYRPGDSPGVFQLGAARFRLGVPVAMATQAGSTEDEDFPGLAALVSPSGEVARLPDWREGSLVVEAGADATVHPVREAVRCLLVDHAGRALLFRYADHRVPHEWWGAPGAGSTPARIIWPRSAGSCARSSTATTSRSGRGSGAAATPSGWAGG